MKKDTFQAVALKYPSNADAPLIVAKEKGLLAEKMIQIAKENHIPVMHDANLVNVLSVKEIGECIPEGSWRAVASIFAFIKSLENENGTIDD